MALWHFLAYLISASCLVAGQQTRYVPKGLEVNLNPGILTLPEDILWMHNGSKVVEFNGQEQEEYGLFKNRITLDWHTAELSITNLGYQDTGDYELEAMVDGKLHKSKFSLEVIDEVTKPTISCEMTDCSSSKMSATLVCAADATQPQSLLKFEWSLDGNTQSRLTIPLGEKNDDKVYTCTVSNPLSTEEASFTAKDCLSDCSSAAPIIISIIVVITLLLVILGIIYCKRYNKACFKTVVEKQMESGATTGSHEETEPLVEKASTPSSNQQQHQGGSNLTSNEAANSHKGDTDSDQNSAEVDDMNVQDDKSQKGLVEKRRHFFESPGKSEEKPEDTASPSPFQQSEQTSSSDQNKAVGGEEGASDADQVGKQQTEIPQSVNEPNPAEVSASSAKDNPETPTPPAQPGSEKNKDEETAPSPSPQRKTSPPLDQNNQSSSDKGGSDVNQLGEEQTENNKEAQPGALSSSQDTTSDVETSTSSQQPGSTEKNELLVNNTSTPSSNQQENQGGSNQMSNEDTNSHKGHTDSDPNSAEGKSEEKPKDTAPPSPFQQSEQTSSSDQNKAVGGEEGASDADQVGKQQTEIPQSVNEPNPAEVSASSAKDNPETPTPPAQPGSEKNKDEETAPSPSPQRKTSPPLDQNNQSSSDKGGSDVNQLGEEQTENNKEAQPGALSSSQDTTSDVETSTSSQQPVEGNDSQDGKPPEGIVENRRKAFEPQGS